MLLKDKIERKNNCNYKRITNIYNIIFNGNYKFKNIIKMFKEL